MEWFLLLEVLWFFLPAGLANMAPVLFSKVPLLNVSVSSKYFGKNKTWRGLVSGVVVGLLVISIQRLIGWNLSFFSYSDSNFLLIGLLLGVGALVGDLVESGVKRWKGVAPGKSWFPWDQLDYILGGLIFVSFVLPLNWVVCLLVIIEYFILHLLVNFIGFQVGVRDEKI
jgi:CDP-2,3-bis-(O-geranylgeranyl)-sn-glycerol synthase